ncbi:hypothetical protein [Anaerosporobacter sp.]|uniref:hypothetical protein n=1 Tax=Anaerosporobacter sp. TaxID=1872529 RepID=UPI00286ED231|nr:hypothetical protein [Anaerosporobacter sp.]
MRKRLLLCTLLIVFILSLTACKKAENSKGFIPPMKGIVWGMTQKDALKVIGDAKYETIELDDGMHVAVILADPITQFGSEAQIYLLFSKELCKNTESGGRLQAVVLRYPNITEEQLLTNMTDEIGDVTRDSSPMKEVKNYIWDSKDVLKDLSKNDYEKITNFLENNEQARNLVDPDNGIVLDVSAEQQPINAIALKKITTNDGDSLSVVYYGDWAYLLKVINEEQ